MRALLRWFLRTVFGFRAFHEEALRTPGPVLLLSNHVSWWDWLLLGVCLEPDWRFVTSSTVAARNRVFRKVMVNRRTFPVDMGSPYAVRHMAEYLQRGGRLVLFPEGRISRTGALMKLFDGTGFLIHKTGARVITAYLRGAGQLRGSPNPNRKRWFPRLEVHFSDALQAPPCPHLSTTAARARITDWLQDQMRRQQFEVEMQRGAPDLLHAITETAQTCPRTVVLQDITLQPLTYRRLLLAVELLARQWQRRWGGAPRRVGLLLPNVNAFPVALLSLWAARHTPAVLNYSGGIGQMLACARLAGLQDIVTSRRFLDMLRLGTDALESAGLRVHCLEDLRAQIGWGEKIRVALRPGRAARLRRAAGWTADDTAVILFTSGSEGPPKGVELTHANLLANIRQMQAMIDVLDTDRFFNALPLFHSFGLTTGLLLPLTRGVFTQLYPSPLHYRVVPSAFYNLDCTVLFGTNTFLAGYARKAHPYDFRSLRLLFAGAEKVQASTAQIWMQRFGVRVLEGYGATECSPVISANTPQRSRQGTAGRFLPGIEYRLEPVAGVSGGGRLWVRGPNVMRGYVNADANAKFRALGGWYDTGDIVQVDEEGFVTILGRVRRFAKISGEMVSLTAVEEALAGAFPQFGLRFRVAVVARPDEQRGEKLIAVTNEARLTPELVREAVRAAGLPPLAVPREVRWLQDIPLLGSGKVNHRELETLV